MKLVQDVAPTDAEIDAIWKQGALRHDLEPSVRGVFRWAARVLLSRYAAQPAAQPADAQDAARYRLVRRGQHWSVIDGIGDTLRAEELDAAADAELARTQGGGNG